jgi:hypothetical protein
MMMVSPRTPPLVRFGSKADISGATSHVRFTPDSDRESGFRRKVMSALPPKADMCGATRDVRFGPEADSRSKKDCYSMTSSAAISKPGGTVKPSAFAVLRLTTVSNFVGVCTGRSAGFAPRRMRST